MIRTIQQAKAAIRRLESGKVISHAERVKADALRQAIKQAETFRDWWM